MIGLRKHVCYWSVRQALTLQTHAQRDDVYRKRHAATSPCTPTLPVSKRWNISHWQGNQNLPWISCQGHSRSWIV